MTIPPWLIQTYGPANPDRIWAYIYTACVFLMFPKSTRRMGGFGLIIAICLYFVSGFLMKAFKQFTPQPTPPPPAKVKRYW